MRSERLTVNRRNNELSRTDRDALRAALESKRAELVRAHEENLSVGTHSGDVAADPMDAATRATEEAELLGLASQERALLLEIDRALAKIADGTYGVSELSGRPIPVERLRAVPWARLVADEEEERERRH
jgi:DnaK suppressor protein